MDMTGRAQRSRRDARPGRSRYWRLAALIAGLALQLPGGAMADGAMAGEPAVTAFLHVNVVPMDRDRVLSDQTVIVRGGTIEAMGAGLTAPPGARVIDGGGRYLSPGLSDMHSHSQTAEEMKVYLANGVTTVLNLGGADSTFVGQLVPRLNRGERPGPHVYVALRIDGTPRYGQFVVETPEQARWAVRLAKVNGYRFIKVYNNLSAPAFAAAADEARRLGMGLAGHHLKAVPLQQELGGGCFVVAHLEELMYGLFKPPASDPLAPPPDATIEQAVTMLKSHRAFVVADLFTFETIAAQWGKPAVAAAMFSRREARYAPPNWRLSWTREDYVTRRGSLDRRAAFEARLVQRLNEAGVGLLAGTDAPTIPGVSPGFSLHEDLEALVRAGLTPFDALVTATRAPGEAIACALHEPRSFGEVKPGYRADLILTKGNPLQDIAALRRPDGVMTAGRWRPESELDGLLKEVDDSYSAAAAMGRPPASAKENGPDGL